MKQMLKGTLKGMLKGVQTDSLTPREHLGVWLGASESGASWRRVFEQLVQRGLTGVEYVVSDDMRGLA